VTGAVLVGCGGGQQPTPTSAPAKPAASPAAVVASPSPSPAASPAAVASPATLASPSPAASPVASPSPAASLRATAELADAQNRVLGRATFTQVAGNAVRIEVQITTGDLQTSLPTGEPRTGSAPGRVGIHIHEFGRCEPPTFMSAGEHFNPTRSQHGFENAQGAHAGDLPNLEIGTTAGGSGLLVTTDRVSLTPGPNSLLDADGSSLVLHAKEDDLRTDPDGNSGERIACGVIQRVAGG